MTEQKRSVLNIWHSAESNTSESQAIILLPGLDESVEMYENFISKLREKIPNKSILAMNLIGQGEGDSLYEDLNSEVISLDNQITLINSEVDRLKIDSIIFLGMSYGATVAIYASSRIKAVKKLFLIAPFVSNLKSYDDGLVGLWFSALSFNPFYNLISKYSLPFYFRLLNDLKMTDSKEVWSNKKIENLTRLTLGLEEIDTNLEISKVKNIGIPCDFLIGELDPLVSINAIRSLSDVLKEDRASLTIIKNGKHRLILEMPDVVSDWVSKNI